MDELVTVFVTVLPNEAYMIQGYLDSEGIESFLKDELTVQVYNFYSNAVGGVKIQVRGDDYDRARAVLKKGGYIKDEEKNVTVQHDVEIVKYDKVVNKKECPFCHSPNIGRSKRLNLISVIVYFILGIFFPVFRRAYKCFDCGREWRYKKSK